jgi:hypothetical protein
MARQRSDLDNNILNSLGEAVVTENKFRNFANDFTDKSSAFFELNPEDEVVVPPEGIGPLLYGRSPTPIRSGLESLKEKFLSGLRNITGVISPRASTTNEILNIAQEILANSNDINEATYMFFPYLQELAPGATYQNARAYLGSVQQPSETSYLFEE